MIRGVAAALVVASTAFAQDPAGSRTPDTVQAIASFFASADAGSIWPGYRPAAEPLLLYLPDAWALMLHGEEQPGFGPPPDRWPALAVPAGFRTGRVDDLVGQLVFDLDLEGVKTAAIPLFAVSPGGRYALPVIDFAFVVHEAFHQYQNGHFAQTDTDPEEAYPILDAENNALAALEMLLLMDAVRAERDGREEELRHLAAMFVAVRRARWERADPVLRTIEQQKELVEGTAKYVEVRSIGAFARLCRDADPAEGGPPLRDLFAPLEEHEYLLADFEDRLRDRSLTPEDVPRNRIYPVGCAQYLLLDHLGSDWQARAESGEGFLIAPLLEEALGITAADMDELAAEAERDYGLEDLRRAAEVRTSEYTTHFREALERFDAQDGVRIEVTFPASGLSRSRSSRERRFTMDRGARVLCPRYVVYTLRLSSGPRCSLQVKDRGVLEEDDAKTATRRATFFSADRPDVELDGAAPELREGETRRFASLRISSRGVDIESQAPGTLTLEGDVLRIRLDAAR